MGWEIKLVLLMIVPLLIAAIICAWCEFWRWNCEMADQKMKRGEKIG